jgi:hypothetical protein
MFDFAVFQTYFTDLIILGSVFGVFLGIQIIWGRQMVINLVCGLILASLLFAYLPLKDKILFGEVGEWLYAISASIVFLVMATFATMTMRRLMPEEYLEHYYESLVKKFSLALAGTGITLFIAIGQIGLASLLPLEPNTLDLLTHTSGYFFWLVVTLVLLYLN